MRTARSVQKADRERRSAGDATFPPSRANAAILPPSQSGVNYADPVFRRKVSVFYFQSLTPGHSNGIFAMKREAVEHWR